MWKLTHGMFDAEALMTEKFPDIPDPTPITAPQATAPEVTTLPNGVRVISQDLHGPIASVALFVGAGSRNETPQTSGVSHVLERIAFKGSHERSKFRMIRDMERTGAVFNASAARETIAYVAEGMREKMPQILPILAESAVQPYAAVEHDNDSMEWDSAVDEIKTQSEIIKKDLESFEKDANSVVSEAIHGVAFHGNTLGKLNNFFLYPSISTPRRESIRSVSLLVLRGYKDRARFSIASQSKGKSKSVFDLRRQRLSCIEIQTGYG